MRKELTRRSQAVSEEWKERMLEAERTLEHQRQDHKEVHSGQFLICPTTVMCVVYYT